MEENKYKLFKNRKFAKLQILIRVNNVIKFHWLFEYNANALNS